MNFQVNILPKKLKSYSKHKQIKVLSPAKINLYLNITGKYKNGFHKIESIVNRISLCDEIMITENDSGNIDFSCSDKTLNKDNLVEKAAWLFKKKYKIKKGFLIYLKKNIPVGAGLGGASSNAAHTLLGLNELLGLGVKKEKLLSMGATLGSDVNFFIHDVPWAFMEGRGEKIRPLDLNVSLEYFLIYPNVRLSTALVYGASKVKLTKFLNNANILLYAIEKKDYHLMEKFGFNCLEKSALSVCSELKRVKNLFSNEGFFCFLTGSGSTFVSFIKNNSVRKKIQKYSSDLIHHKGYHGWRTFDVKTY